MTLSHENHDDSFPRGGDATTVFGVKRSRSLWDLLQEARANEGVVGTRQREEEEQEYAAADEDEEERPPDGGWGWMVALGSFINMTLIPMMTRCFGVIFSRYLLQEGASSTTAAWIFNAFGFIWNFMGPITRPLTREFGWRRVAVTAAALASLSFIMSAFAPCPAFLFFSFSLLCGAGGGIVTCVCFNIVPLYFDRKRGMANAITMAGVCVGPIVGAPLVRLLQDEYSFRGAALILGGLILHSCVGASFFHPVEWHSRKAQAISQPLVSPKEKSENNNLSVSKGSLTSKSLRESATDLEKVIADARLTRGLRGGGRRRLSETSRSSWRNSSLAVSMLHMTSMVAIPDEGGDSLSDEEEGGGGGSNSVCDVVRRLMRSTMSDLKVLRSPRALIVGLGGALCINGYFNFMMMVPFAMQAAGHSLEDAAWCLSVASICNLALRILVSTLSDTSWINVQRCYMAGFTVISFTMFIFPLLTELTHLLVTMASFGCGVGITMGLYNLVMIDVMGIGNLAPVIGSSSFMVAVGFVCLGPPIGFIRDVSNSYTPSMWMVSAMLLASFALWLFMPVAVRYDQRKNEEKEKQDLS